MKLRLEDGFTVAEIMIVLTVTSVLSGTILFFSFSYWRYAALIEADLDTFVTRLNAGDVIRELVGTSSGLIIQNSITDSNAHKPDPAIPSNLYWTPIHAVPGNTPMPTTGYTSVLYFRRYSRNSSGALIMNGVQPYEDEYVIYMNSSTKQLLLRSLANPSATGNKLKTSCPAASATTSCPADKIIAADIASVDLRYFSRTGNLQDYHSSTDPVTGAYTGPDYPSVDVVEFGLNITKKPFLQTTKATTNKTVIRIALRNT